MKAIMSETLREIISDPQGNKEPLQILMNVRYSVFKKLDYRYALNSAHQSGFFIYANSLQQASTYRGSTD